jgi:uncharacterized protein (DUF1778 family)
MNERAKIITEQALAMKDFVDSAATEAARKTFEESAVLKVSTEDQQRFAEALIAPAPLTPAMERAISHHRRLIRS